MLIDQQQIKMTRRQFLNWAFKLGSSFMLGGVLFSERYLKLFREADALEAKVAERWVYSTCSFCAVGCGVLLGVEQGKIVAVKGISDHPVNGGYLCVKGIYQYQVIAVQNRATQPLLRQDGDFIPVKWDYILDLLAEKFNEVINTQGPNALGIYHGSQMLQEEYYTIAKLARGGIGTKNLDANPRLCSLSASEGYSRSLGDSATPGNYKDFEESDCILIVGENLAENHPIIYYRLRRAKDNHNPTIILVDPRRTPTAEIADYHLSLKADTDVYLFNAIIHVLIKEDLIDKSFIDKYTINYEALSESVEDFTPEKVAQITGIAAQTIRKIALIYGNAQKALIAWSVGVNHNIDGTRIVNLFNNLSLITANMGRPGTGPFYLQGQCSSAGQVGSITSLPGGRDFDKEEEREEIAELWGVSLERIPTKEGVITRDMWEEMERGELKALWVIATNPMLSMPDTNAFQELLENLELLVVQDIYADTATAQLADVILPAAMWSEKTGTFVNSERRVNLVKKAVQAPGEALPDWKIVTLIAQRMGYTDLLDFNSTTEIFAEWRQVSKGTSKDMSGMTYQKIEELGGIPYPCSSLESEGTPRLYSQMDFPTPDAKARLITAKYKGPGEERDEEYPFVMLTGRVLQLWMTNTRTRHSPELMSEIPAPFVEISIQDAKQLKINDREEVKVISRRGSIKLKAWVTDRILTGHIFIPFHFSEAPVNRLTIKSLDPYSQEPALKSAAVKIEKLKESN